MMPLQQQLRTPPNSTLSSVRVSVGAGVRRAFESAAHAKTSTPGAGAPVKRAGEKRMDRTVHTLFILGRSLVRALLAYEFAI